VSSLSFDDEFLRIFEPNWFRREKKTLSLTEDHSTARYHIHLHAKLLSDFIRNELESETYAQSRMLSADCKGIDSPFD
jgi:hypothetical protein